MRGRSGNIYAFPNCKKSLVTDETETDDPSVIGEEAHIVGKKVDGPRGENDMTDEQRNSYNNLILLCSVHHKQVDDQRIHFTIDRLRKFKSAHEESVKKSLTVDEQKQRDDELYASYIDKINQMASVENWKGWTSFLLGGDSPRIYAEIYDQLQRLIEFLISRVWPRRYTDLEQLISNFKNVLNDLLIVLSKYADRVGAAEEWYSTRKFYHIDEWNPELYDALHKKWMYHMNLVQDLTLELTRALNYLFDKVRFRLFPSYRISEGVLLIYAGTFMDMTDRTYRVEYQGEQRTDRPYNGLRAFMEERSNRDLQFGEGFSQDYFLGDFM